MPVEIKYVLKIRLLKEKSCEPLCVTVWKYGPCPDDTSGLYFLVCLKLRPLPRLHELPLFFGLFETTAPDR